MIMRDMKSFQVANKLHELLNQIKSLRKTYEEIPEQSKDDPNFELFLTLHKPIKELEKTIVTMLDDLHLDGLHFIKETMQWNNEYGKSNDYIVKAVGQKVVDEALNLKD